MVLCSLEGFENQWTFEKRKIFKSNGIKDPNSRMKYSFSSFHQEPTMNCILSIPKIAKEPNGHSPRTIPSDCIQIPQGESTKKINYKRNNYKKNRKIKDSFKLNLKNIIFFSFCTRFLVFKLSNHDILV